MQLYFREYGEPRGEKPSLVFLHGLFGSSVNWHSIARQFEPDWHCIAVDLRNHGRSPHDSNMDYAEMAGDVLALLDQLMLEKVIPVGHSMGGKTALALAQLYSERVERLVVGDIAPVAYDHEFDSILAGFRAVELETIKSRGDADDMMGARIQHPGIRQYLLQNLVRENEQWQWRLNLDELERCMASITGYAPGCDHGYAGKSLIIRGELSDYVLPEHEQIIRQCLPDVRIETLPGVGHWVYAEDPAGFVSLLRDFIES